MLFSVFRCGGKENLFFEVDSNYPGSQFFNTGQDLVGTQRHLSFIVVSLSFPPSLGFSFCVYNVTENRREGGKEGKRNDNLFHDTVKKKVASFWNKNHLEFLCVCVCVHVI
mgnify:CR=1 FL=1